MVEIDFLETGEPLRRPWKRGIAVGRAYDLTRADLLGHLRWLQSHVGFENCRFHGVFHDDMAVVSRGRSGRLVFNWTHVDKVYDALLGLGLRPFVELNPMPRALASGEQTMFYYKMNVTPPARWEEWETLVREFVTHCVERWGLPEVRRWHFEVWNEPNLSAFWSGTKEDYFRLYAHAARAVKSVDESLRVGGPATSKAHWLEDLMRFCARERVPLDFLSTHLYPQDEFVEFSEPGSSPHEPGEFFGNVIREAGELARRGVPGLPGPVPLHWTEWNTQLAAGPESVTWVANRYVDALPGASFVARNMIALDDAAESFFYWVASDVFEEGPMPQAPFTQTYGLLTMHGLPKAAANAFRFLERLRGPRLEVAVDGPAKWCGAVATREGAGVTALLWNDAPLQAKEPPRWEGTLRLKGLPSQSGAWVVTEGRVASGRGSAFEAWEALGSPRNLSAPQWEWLRACAEPSWHARRLEVRGGALELSFNLGPNEVAFFELQPAADSAIEASAEKLDAATAQTLEAQLGEKSRD